MCLAGGLAGGLANAIIYPIDTLKTMRQTDPTLKTIWDAIRRLIQTNNKQGSSIVKIYAGIGPAVIGSIPSSAVYFGSYEAAKTILKRHSSGVFVQYKPLIHMLAAATGNIFSSVIFVPKDALKQQLQSYRTGSIAWTASNKMITKLNSFDVIKAILDKHGVSGFYPSYRATLLRNIPSAVLKFTLYEELRLIAQHFKGYESIGYLLAGGFSSGFASAITTPFDVIKTRIATGLLAPRSPVFRSLIKIAKNEGISSLYAGVYARVVWSALFGGIGFTCFEMCKELLGASNTINPDRTVNSICVKVIESKRH
eukprot:gene7847-10654_t